jgi:hypothetical protein
MCGQTSKERDSHITGEEKRPPFFLLTRRGPHLHTSVSQMPVQIAYWLFSNIYGNAQHKLSPDEQTVNQQFYSDVLWDLLKKYGEYAAWKDAL